MEFLFLVLIVMVVCLVVSLVTAFAKANGARRKVEELEGRLLPLHRACEPAHADQRYYLLGQLILHAVLIPL